MIVNCLSAHLVVNFYKCDNKFYKFESKFIILKRSVNVFIENYYSHFDLLMPNNNNSLVNESGGKKSDEVKILQSREVSTCSVPIGNITRDREGSLEREKRLKDGRINIKNLRSGVAGAKRESLNNIFELANQVCVCCWRTFYKEGIVPIRETQMDFLMKFRIATKRFNNINESSKLCHTCSGQLKKKKLPVFSI